MDTFRFHHQFHAVGHGTFFTGLVEAQDGTAFRWGYDCGSRSSNRIREAIDELSWERHWRPNTAVDMMVVSHFDNDHVNGLEQFLETYRVKWLVLPYVGLKQRLAHAASLGDEDISSAATAGFAIDPIGYLYARGLSDRVDGVLLVQGGGGDGASDGGDPLPDPALLDGVRRDARDGETPDPADPGQYQDRGPGGAAAEARVLRRSHRQVVSVAGTFPFEFVFFNTALPESVANRSRRDMRQVARDVASIFKRFDVLAPGRQARRGWRAELRACYDRHFGDSGAERNNISLCTLMRPLANAYPPVCPLCDSWCGCEIEHCANHWHGWPERFSGTQGLLLTGDVTLDDATLSEMQTHFGTARWSQLQVVQVPHHGSRHSWFPGNAHRFPDPAFVHCVPSNPGKYPRPHPDVEADLRMSRVLNADDDSPVIQAYFVHA